MVANGQDPPTAEPISPQTSIDKLTVSFAKDGSRQEEVEVMKDGGEEEGDEYSASANAILEKGRSDSWRRKGDKRRRSGEGSLRRRSSVFTTSSGDIGISIEDDRHQEQVYHNVRIHKEVVAQVKYQPWPIRKKLRIVQEAKSYIKLHEGHIHDRLAQRRTARAVLAHINILLINYWHYVKREIGNLANNMIPWESRIKMIESHFGSVVASYFIFLRWLFSVNVIIATILLVFLAIPEVLFGNKGFSGERKVIPKEERSKAMNFLTLWNFEGILKYSPLFYGFYNSENRNNNIFGNKLPLVYFVVSLGVYVYSFVAILRKMAVNSRQSKLSEKDDDCIFTWKMFTSWDFMIGNPETAHNRRASIVLGFKEALLEEAEKTREEGRNWKLFSIRIFTHFNVIWLLASSMYAVIKVVERSDKNNQRGWWRQNEVTFVITMIGTVYPIVFDGISYLERYHPRKALRLQLARIMVLNLLNLYSFIFATFSKIHIMSSRLVALKGNLTKIIPNITESRSNNITRLPGGVTTAITESLAIAAILTNFTSNNGLMTDKPENFTLINDTLLNYTQNIELPTAIPELRTLKSSSDYQINLSAPNTSMELSTMSDNNYISSILVQPESELQINKENANLPDTFQEFKKCINDCGETDNVSTESYFFTADDFEAKGEVNYGNISHQGIQNSTRKEDNMETETASNSVADWTAFPFTSPSGNNKISEKDSNWVNRLEQTRAPFKDGYQHVTNSIGIDASYSSVSYATSPSSDKCTTEADSPRTDLSLYTRFLDKENRKKLHTLCWETMFGQELVKLTVMDLIMTIIGIIMGDFVRALFVRFMNSCWCWDLEKKFPQYADFKIAENILHLVNNQGMVWMGMFFSPGLPLINVLKLIIIMYLRSWAVLTCDIPHEVVFRASRSNNFYFWLLLTMLFLCVLPVGYALVSIEPSWHCGPFSNYHKIYHLFTSSLKKLFPGELFNRVLDYIASPGIVIPLLMLLILIIYYLLSLTNALREANEDLKIQLRRERTEERRKMFQIANKKRRGTELLDSPFSKWYKIVNGSSLRKISLDNTANTTKDEVYQSKSVINDVQGNQEVKSRISEEMESEAMNKYKKTGKMSENWVNNEGLVSPTNSDNIPEIKISKTYLKNEELASCRTNSKDVTETSEELHDNVFIEH